MITGGIEATKSLAGDWSHRVLAEKMLVEFRISPEGIRQIADALDKESRANNGYYPGVILKDEANGSVVIGKIPFGVAELKAYTTEPYWGDITLYISTERLRIIADRLELQPEISFPKHRVIHWHIKEIAEICGGIVVIFRFISS